jgi:hypothetical protein
MEGAVTISPWSLDGRSLRSELLFLGVGIRARDRKGLALLVPFVSGRPKRGAVGFAANRWELS